MTLPHHLSPPIVIYGLLEDLIEEVNRNHNAGKTAHAIRISTSFRTHITHYGEEQTLVYVIVTTMTTEQQNQELFHQYGFWSWLIDSYTEVNGRSLSSRTRHDASRFSEKVIESLHRGIEYRLLRPVPVKKGVYSLDPHITEVSGTTNMLELEVLRNLLHPQEGVKAYQLCLRPDEEVVCGTERDHVFHEFNEGRTTTVSVDEHVRILSADHHLTHWIRFSNNLDMVIAARTEKSDGPTYRVLYSLEQGWIGQ